MDNFCVAREARSDIRDHFIRTTHVGGRNIGRTYTINGKNQRNFSIKKIITANHHEIRKDVPFNYSHNS